ncbi:MAG TPA: GNAT family N-acetyltransferase [Candidatus Polarisedimenticolia bacterium]|jgi:GNAT superfamily N-acetyltransferase|nr:GNAT family N-acetyltransferase [Candidatus Polarisedimenticolia bacterium]
MTRIVRGTTAHLGALAHLMTNSPLLHRYGVTARGARASLAQALRERDLVLVSVDGDSVIGFAWAITTRALDRSAYLRLLLVSEEHQSRGVGAALLARVEREARSAQCRHLVLLVTRTNKRARSFYERHGYARVGDLAGFVRPGIAESLYLKSWGT